MIALFDFTPSHCPNCGRAFNLTGAVRDGDGHVCYRRDADYLAGASHSCKCGLHYQYAKRETLLDAADKDGDLARNVEWAEWQGEREAARVALGGEA